MEPLEVVFSCVKKDGEDSLLVARGVPSRRVCVCVQILLHACNGGPSMMSQTDHLWLIYVITDWSNIIMAQTLLSSQCPVPSWIEDGLLSERVYYWKCAV